MRIRIDEVNFGNRHRKEMGDLGALAGSIKTVGLLNPITVAKVYSGYLLLAGARRLKATRDVLHETMIEANVVKFDDPLERLLVEREENDQRLPFTTSEMVSIGKTIEKTLGDRKGKRTDLASNEAKLPEGKTTAIAAEGAGFTSTSTYERAKAVVENGTPELVKDMDDGKVSIGAAAAKVKPPRKPPSKSGKLVFDDTEINKAFGKLARLFDDRGAKVGKTAEYGVCMGLMNDVATAWKRWQKAST